MLCTLNVHTTMWQAKKAYEKALRIDPVFLEATLALVGLHMEDKEYDTCIKL